MPSGPVTTIVEPEADPAPGDKGTRGMPVVIGVPAGGETTTEVLPELRGLGIP